MTPLWKMHCQSMRTCILQLSLSLSISSLVWIYSKHVSEADDFIFKMDFDWDDIEKKFFKKAEIMGNGKGCIEWVGCKKGNTGYGVQVVKWKEGESKREAAHRLAYMIRHRVTRYDMPSHDLNNNKIECSHLCHHTLCVNPDHIVLEPHTINQDRIHCKNQGHCSKSHQPYCLMCKIYKFNRIYSTTHRYFPFLCGLAVRMLRVFLR